ncbi:MAG TPA: NAD-dependent epimerase/dehydratase family protein [Verrucomicrobiae bacterium]|jgi:UDP-glucose 4-epimerase|nr:NAD-dependent epimerase/dehydratase family protein [Verrucomicrobiae bacterium]
MLRVLITGVAGMMGSHMLDRLMAEGAEVIGIDDLSAGKLSHINSHLTSPRFRFVQADVRDFEALSAAAGERLDWILHFAAMKKCGESGDALATLQVNGGGAESCLRLACRTGAAVLLASTADVYGLSTELPFRETGDLVLGVPGTKRWAYAASKLYAESLALAYAKQENVRVVVLRYFGGFSHRSCFDWRGGHVPVFADQALRGEPFTIHGDGLQTRSATSALNLVEGTWLAMRTPAVGEILNIGGDEEISVIDTARLIHRLAGKNGEPAFQFIPMANIFGEYREIPRRLPCLEKSARLLGYRPRYRLEEALQSLLAERRREISLQPA